LERIVTVVPHHVFFVAVQTKAITTFSCTTLQIINPLIFMVKEEPILVITNGLDE